MIALLIGFGAFVGAPARYLTDRWVQGRHAVAAPWGTWTVNIAACLILGVVTGSLADQPAVTALLGGGFCGALSTYSTFGFETLRLAQDGRRRLAAGYAIGSVGAGLGVAALGWWLATVL